MKLLYLFSKECLEAIVRVLRISMLRTFFLAAAENWKFEEFYQNLDLRNKLIWDHIVTLKDPAILHV
jgi:hypothetical protein